MKSKLKVAAIAVAMASPAMAANFVNMENPLYQPRTNEVYSKTAVGYMIKKTDDTEAQQAWDHANTWESPIWRIYQDLGYGITDRLAVYGQVGYTNNPGQDRAGLHAGRIGVNYRALADESNLVWDVYADAHLGGLSKMTGTFHGPVTMGMNGFKYDGYGTGQYGMYVGTRIGHTWDALTAAAYLEFGHMFRNDNTEITLELPGMLAGAAAAYFPDGIKGKAVADLYGFTDWVVGAKALYQVDDTWSIGMGVARKHHAQHVVKTGKATVTNAVAPGPVPPFPPAETVNAQVAQGIANMFSGITFGDSFTEYPIQLLIANQLTENVQVTLYGEYTFDKGDYGSQNTTDFKLETGVRLNVWF